VEGHHEHAGVTRIWDVVTIASPSSVALQSDWAGPACASPDSAANHPLTRIGALTVDSARRSSPRNTTLVMLRPT